VYIYEYIYMNTYVYTYIYIYIYICTYIYTYIFQDYQLLVARQWQLAENLSKRDEGDMRGLSMEIQGLTSGTHELFQQLDYLQHRVQKQEVSVPCSVCCSVCCSYLWHP